MRAISCSRLTSRAQTRSNATKARYAKTVTVWGKALTVAGVKEDVLHGILVDNPRRFLAYVPKKKHPSV